MKKNKVRLWQLLGVATVLIAARIYRPKKPGALPLASTGAKDHGDHRRAETVPAGESAEDTPC